MRRAEEQSFIGRLVANRYRLIARLGDSPMAEVYLARHVLIDRLSAIKVLRADVGRDRGLRALFLREAKAVNRINHPNIVEITDYGETAETAFLVMEYVPGEPLSRLLAHGPLGWQRAARIAVQVGLALSRAHEMGVIHRDLKPSNVLVVPRRGADDIVKLTDFGVAKLLSSSGPEHTGTTGLLPAHVSPAHVAPELSSTGTLDAKSDLFSLGVVAYECACGALPYGTDRSAPRPPPRKTSELAPDVPPAFDEVVARLLAWSPDDRPRDAFEAVALFRSVLDATEGEEEIADDSDPPTVRTRPRTAARRGARLSSMPFDRIVPTCVEAWRLVRDAAEGEVRPGLSDDLRQAGELMVMVERLGAVVADDTRALAAAEERGRIVRREFGARIDELALARSKALGWAGSLAEQSDRVRTKRLSGAHPVAHVDAMLWEEATLEHTEELSRARADEMADDIAELQRQLSLANEALERGRAVLGAQLEGHVAALRALASEVWMALEALADLCDVPLPVA
jgi:serine/threonine-protein kinase